MTTAKIDVKTGLTKVLADLIGNRKNLAGQIEAQELQTGVQKEQLAHFDVIIGAMKLQLKDASGTLDADVAAEMADPALLEVPAAPLAAAGVDPNAAGSASANGDEGTDGNGSPVA